MKVYFNTKAFGCLENKACLDITKDISKAELAVLGSKSINFEKAEKLKAVYRFGVGRENIPDSIIKKGSPQVFFPSEKTRDVLFESTANFAVSLIFHMYYYKVRGDVGTWEKTTRNLISSKKCLIIGCGNIGSRVYEKLMPFLSVKKYDVKYNSPSDLKRLVEEADIISVHIPLNEQTRGFFDSEKLSWIKNDAVIVNTSRGAVFEEKALYKRLMGSDIGAAFDVFWKEPYHGRLKDLGKDKFLMTPHTSSQTLEYVESGFKDILDIIKKFEGKQ